MTIVCHGPGRERHEIEESARRVDLRFSIDWGGDDVRESHSKPLTFCSFQCLADWAAEKTEQHDGHVLVEGEPEEPVS